MGALRQPVLSSVLKTTGLLLSRVGCLAALMGLFGSGSSAQQKLAEGSSGQSTVLAKEIVAAHNLLRNKIGVPPLVWSDEVAKSAQDWANTLLAKGAFTHRQGLQYGENLYAGSGFPATAHYVVNAWAEESRNYQYTVNKCSAVCGHYTQIVWRDTRAVGCGVARGANREVWVCNYAPYGNIVGERPY